MSTTTITKELQAPAQVTPMDLIQRASANGATIEQMQQLFDLKLRVEADEARKAFNVAMANFKKNPPQINKNKHVKFGQTEYDHATLDHVVDSITPALSSVGIRWRWDVDQSVKGEATVTCILSHEDGYSESTKITANYDTSGSKNGIQAIASTITYLQRYTLLAATGLAAAGADNDGATADKGPRMPQGQLLDYLSAIEAAADIEALKRAYFPALGVAQKVGDKAAETELQNAKDRRKSQL